MINFKIIDPASKEEIGQIVEYTLGVKFSDGACEYISYMPREDGNEPIYTLNTGKEVQLLVS